MLGNYINKPMFYLFLGLYKADVHGGPGAGGNHGNGGFGGNGNRPGYGGNGNHQNGFNANSGYTY